MPQDAYTLRYLCKELNDIFSGGKINRIVQPSNDETIFTVYTGKRTEKLFIDVNPSMPRIGVVDYEKESPLTAPNFCMLLRKHLLSATIDNISLVGFDRIVRIDLTPSAEFFDVVPKTLFVELMGRYSNIILTEKGKILGGNRGINFFDNGVRPLIVGREYSFPPVNDKKLPTDKELLNVFDGNCLAKQIASNVQGVALSTATEIEREYFNQYPQFNGESFFEFLNNFLFNERYEPCVFIENGELKDVCVFPYKSVTGEAKRFDKLYQAEEYFFYKKNKLKKFNALKERLNSAVGAAYKKANKRLSLILAREKDAFNVEENRIKGELILANIFKIRERDSFVIVDNYYDNTELKIQLEQGLTPSQNAERYFKKYNKQKRTLSALIPQKESAKNEIEYLSSLLDFISFADNIDDLVCVKEELILAGVIKEEKQSNKKQKTTQDGRIYLIDGFTVKAGRNNAENDKIAFSAQPEDLWFHCKDYHSSHLVIRKENREIPQRTVQTVAEICAYYSKGKNGGKVEVVYTTRKNLKKPPKSKPGFCIYSDFKSITCEPNAHVECLKNN